MEEVLLRGWPLGDKVRADAITGLLFKDSDRSAAIVACTILEDSLEKRLKSTLRDSTIFAKLFDTGRPLHFFGSRNQLAYLMRIYGKPFFRELETIGGIRNAFAHMYADKAGNPIKSFQSPAIKKLCDELRLMEHLQRAEAKRVEDLGLSTGKKPSWAKGSEPLEVLRNPRVRYVQTCGLCVSALSGHLDPNITKTIWADRFP
jgi:hypothetical protein